MKKLHLLPLLTLLAIAGCSPANQPADPADPAESTSVPEASPPQSQPEAEPSARDGDYVLVELAGENAPSTPTVIFTVTGPRLSIAGPVNRINGAVGEDGSLGPLMSTRMAGPQPLMEYETRVLQTLEGATLRTGASDGELILEKDGAPAAVLKKKPAAETGGPSPEWLKAVEAKVKITDDQGHGPDLGSAEWLSAVDRKLGISDDAGHGPDLGSAEWRGAVDRKLGQD